MKRVFLRAIKFYQNFPPFHWPIFRILFMSDRVCRFRPTCSEYAYQALEKYGILKGSFLGIKRILGCHPWTKGGDDPV